MRLTLSRHADHGGAWRASNNRWTRQGNKCFGKEESPRGWWHPTRDFEDWETSTHATSARTPLSLLGKGLCSSKYAWRHHPLQEQGRLQWLWQLPRHFAPQNCWEGLSSGFSLPLAKQCGFRPGRSTTDMIFLLRQVQEKCREERMPLYITFINLTKAFDLVSKRGLLKILKLIGCHPRLLNILASFHEDTHNIVSFNGTTSEAFPVSSDVKQGCVLALTLFGIFFSLLLQYAFSDCDDGVYLHTRTDGKLFNITRLRAKTKVRCILIRERLFADDAGLVSHSVRLTHLQRLVDRFAHACKEFGLTLSPKKTKVMAQDSDVSPVIAINGQPLEVVPTFTYLGSTVCESRLGTEQQDWQGRGCNGQAK